MEMSVSIFGFTNCLLPTEDGGLVEKDLWIDQRRGVLVDPQSTFYSKRQRPDVVIDLEGHILSPGFLDIQINGAYGFDFSVYDHDDAYTAGLKAVAEKILETGVTCLVPTIITQEKSLYPKILNLLRPFSSPTSATLLGWHAEGPFLQPAKRGAHAPSLLLSAPEGITTFEATYGSQNLVPAKDWCDESSLGVRIITAAPEIKGVMDAMEELCERGIVFAMGHSIATTDVATSAVVHGARLITHLFNAMPTLHHRDPSIIGLLGASPYLSISSTTTPETYLRKPITDHVHPGTSEAFDNIDTPPFRMDSMPITPVGWKTPARGLAVPVPGVPFERPFYDIIVDGIHSHPNSVRLAYSTHPEGCILITDAMKILDPHLKDGIHEWRDGKRFVKQGDKLLLEGTDTLAGSVVTLDKCIRNLSRFTGCSLSEAIKCATYNPAKCLGIENRKGTLRPGADADLVVLDRNGFVQSTWVKGKKVWSR